MMSRKLALWSVRELSFTNYFLGSSMGATKAVSWSAWHASNGELFKLSACDRGGGFGLYAGIICKA